MESLSMVSHTNALIKNRETIDSKNITRKQKAQSEN